MYDVIVIGGGAAGMMAAGTAAEKGASVLLLEKNEKLGKKIYITGKGRCNFTNTCDIDTFMDNIVSNPRFMYSSLAAFGSADMISLLEAEGCRTKQERGMRAFPASDHASDVTRALSKRMLRNKVHTELSVRVISISKEERDGRGFFAANAVKEGRKVAYRARKAIIATGGLSYPSTGSTGDGYRFAEGFGLDIKGQVPALIPLETAEADECRSMQGVSLRNVSLSFADKRTGKRIYDAGTGELIFTHYGMSGPLVLRASSHLSRGLHDGKQYTASIDLKPGLDEKRLDDRILRDLAVSPNACMRSVSAGLLISSLRDTVLRRAGIDPHLKAAELKKARRQSLLHVIKHLEYTVTGTRGYDEAVITQGGVKVSGIDPSTMESRKVPGLYFAGEIIDIDAHTGGFNLQLAWSTGHAAGEAAGSSI